MGVRRNSARPTHAELLWKADIRPVRSMSHSGFEADLRRCGIFPIGQAQASLAHSPEPPAAEELGF